MIKCSLAQLKLAGWLGACLAVSASALSAEYALKADGQIVGEIGSHPVTRQETLLDIARAHDLGYTQLMAANQGVDPWLPKEGAPIVIPSTYILPEKPPAGGIVINLALQRLFYFPKGDKRVLTFPIGVGAEGYNTPLGKTSVVRKAASPSWYPPSSIRAENPELPELVPPGPDNPLGQYALYLHWEGFVVHGTNKPYGVGRTVSHGCIRLYPEDIEALFRVVPVGTSVLVISQDSAVAWFGDRLMAQVFPSKSQSAEIEAGALVTPQASPDLIGLVIGAALRRPAEIDWQAVKRAASDRTGMIVEIGRASTCLAGNGQGC